MFVNSVDKKVAVVTGASSGLGEHFCRTLGQQGARVAMLARRLDRLEQLDDELTAAGVDTLALQADVTDRPALEQAFETAHRHFGQIDLLVNNAGIAATDPFLDMSEQAWQDVIDIDLTGVWRSGQIAARIMSTQSQGGCIINVSSVLATAVQPTQTNYGAAKAGVSHLTRLMARELARYRIRVNAIAPGYFETEINREYFSTEAGRKYVARLFPRRVGQLDELDGALLLLASEAGSYINGTVITVDGGATLGSL